jgi:hypothetical protein
MSKEKEMRDCESRWVQQVCGELPTISRRKFGTFDPCEVLHQTTGGEQSVLWTDYDGSPRYFKRCADVKRPASHSPMDCMQLSESSSGLQSHVVAFHAIVLNVKPCLFIFGSTVELELIDDDDEFIWGSHTISCWITVRPSDTQCIWFITDRSNLSIIDNSHCSHRLDRWCHC